MTYFFIFLMLFFLGSESFSSVNRSLHEEQFNQNDYVLTIFSSNRDDDDEKSKASLRFSSHPGIPLDAIIESESYEALKRAELYVNYLYPEMRPEGLPSLLLLLKLGHEGCPMDACNRVRCLCQGTYDLSEIFKQKDIEYALCGKSLLAFKRHGGLCKWHKKIYFAVKSDDHSKIESCETILQKLGYTLGWKTMNKRILYATKNLKLQAPKEEEVFTPSAPWPLVVIRFYDRVKEGLRFLEDPIPLDEKSEKGQRFLETPLIKSDFISHAMWKGKTLNTFPKCKGDYIKVNILSNSETYLKTLYGEDWETHELSKGVKRALTQDDLKALEPPRYLRTLKPLVAYDDPWFKDSLPFFK